jgi:oxygen-independent coproporphyrinogen-3 oxidase
MSRFGVYIHYPWCRHRCSYCDFPIAIAKGAAIPHRTYADAVLTELAERGQEFASGTLATIYIGGGTPSLWPPEHLAAVINAVRDRFDGDPEEVTLEANPTDCVPPRLAEWLEAGINRLSIGVQSYSPEALQLLGRDHSMGQGAAGLVHALEAGFKSASADLILGVPGGSTTVDLHRLLALRPPHLSVYELTYEDRAPLRLWAQRGDVVPVADDVVADLYEATHHRLVAAGYEHYEVSNYAQPGHRSVHNSLYWQGAPYLGLGNGASSLVRYPGGSGRRWQNHRSVKVYMRAEGSAREAHHEEITPGEMRRDLTWLGLRTRDGIASDAIAEHPQLAAWLIQGGLVEEAGGRLRPTLRGFLQSDAVARRVVASWG